MNKLLQAWRSWRQLSQQERFQSAQALLLLQFVALSLRLFGLGWVQASLDQITLRKPSRADFPTSETLARNFQRAARWSLLPASCLARSLVLCWLLRNQGLEADFRIGIAKINGQFSAHAWVEHKGMALSEDDIDHQFVAFDQIVTTQHRK